MTSRITLERSRMTNDYIIHEALQKHLCLKRIDILFYFFFF